jgi:hypothetical protein
VRVQDSQIPDYLTVIPPKEIKSNESKLFEKWFLMNHPITVPNIYVDWGKIWIPNFLSFLLGRPNATSAKTSFIGGNFVDIGSDGSRCRSGA